MRSFSNVIPGLAIIILGAGLLMDRLGYMELNYGRILHTWWPLILVIIGLGMLFDQPRERKVK